MTFSVVLFLLRKPGKSIDEFQEHWEKTHIPLLKSIGGSAFPLSHTRHYPARVDGNPVVPVGNAADVNWDGFAKLDFTDEQHFRRFAAAVTEPEAAAKIQKDEEKFADRSSLRIVILGDVIPTLATFTPSYLAKLISVIPLV